MSHYQDPETEAAEWNSAVINFIIYTCTFPTVTCQNVFRETGPYCHSWPATIKWKMKLHKKKPAEERLTYCWHSQTFYKHVNCIKRPQLAILEVGSLGFLLCGSCKPLNHHAVHILVLQDQELDCQHKRNSFIMTLSVVICLENPLKCMFQDNHSLFWGKCESRAQPSSSRDICLSELQ